MISSLVLAHRQLGVRASGPVELQVNGRRIVTRVGDDLLENRAQDFFFNLIGACGLSHARSKSSPRKAVGRAVRV